MIGEKVNYLTVLEKIKHPTTNKSIYKCRCICGKISLKPVTDVENGKVYSCGCRRGELVAAKLRNKNKPYMAERWEKYREKLWEEGFQPKGEDECWEWQGRVDETSGYGVMREKGHYVGAHRFSYEKFVGPIPEGLFVLHHCDNRPCINPKHLYVGTQQDNMRDMRERGRRKGIGVGTDNGRAKLDYDKADKIRELYATGEYSQHLLAYMFEVDQTQISKVILGKRWVREGTE